MAAYYTFEDYSGGQSNGLKSDNPYQDMIDSCHNDPTQIQARYNTHRTTRNAQQKTKLLSPDFPGVTVDEILSKLLHPTLHPAFHDPRHCLVFWARPPARIRSLIAQIQQKLLSAAPNLWLMPPLDLHMTALEITHSRTESEIDLLTSTLLPQAPVLTDYTLSHRAKLVKPLLSFDAQALALSFLPAESGDGLGLRQGEDGGGRFTYHHLRRDLLALAQGAGVKVESRYVIPSAHLTIGRFVEKGGFETEGGGGVVDGEKVRGLVESVEGINGWLEDEVWGGEDGEWVVGEEKGLEFRKGALWYGGGGETVLLGKGFERGS